MMKVRLSEHGQTTYPSAVSDMAPSRPRTPLVVLGIANSVTPKLPVRRHFLFPPGESVAAPKGKKLQLPAVARMTICWWQLPDVQE